MAEAPPQMAGGDSSAATLLEIQAANGELGLALTEALVERDRLRGALLLAKSALRLVLEDEWRAHRIANAVLRGDVETELADEDQAVLRFAIAEAERGAAGERDG